MNPGTIYVAVEEDGPSKIGVAVDPAKRLKVVARQCDKPLRLVWSMPFPKCRQAETLVCRMLHRHRHKGFRVEGNSEWFDVPPERVIAAAENAMQAVDAQDAAPPRVISKRRPAAMPRHVKGTPRKRVDLLDETLRTIAALERQAATTRKERP